jgi:DNA-binding winged helix-turn-helix (wHTH) protein
MTTKALTRCYRFHDVDFEPDLNLLVWHDETETHLTLHESRLLEVLCYFSGEVITSQTLFDRTFVQLGPDKENEHDQFDLNSLLIALNKKLTHNDVMAIPIQVVPKYGFRVPLPEKTCRLFHTFKEPKTEIVPILPKNETPLSTTEDIVKNSITHKVSVVLIAVAGILLYLASEL